MVGLGIGLENFLKWVPFCYRLSQGGKSVESDAFGQSPFLVGECDRRWRFGFAKDDNRDPPIFRTRPKLRHSYRIKGHGTRKRVALILAIVLVSFSTFGFRRSLAQHEVLGSYCPPIGPGRHGLHCEGEGRLEGCH